MKKDIIICNTYFQLIEAIQLKNTLFLHESVTVVFSDHSRNAENIIKQIKSLDIFEQCFFWSSFKKMKEQEKIRMKIVGFFYVRSMEKMATAIHLNLEFAMN